MATCKTQSGRQLHSKPKASVREVPGPQVRFLGPQQGSAATEGAGRLRDGL